MITQKKALEDQLKAYNEEQAALAEAAAAEAAAKDIAKITSFEKLETSVAPGAESGGREGRSTDPSAKLRE